MGQDEGSKQGYNADVSVGHNPQGRYYNDGYSEGHQNSTPDVQNHSSTCAPLSAPTTTSQNHVREVERQTTEDIFEFVNF
jgi:hypothetical protein